MAQSWSAWGTGIMDVILDMPMYGIEYANRDSPSVRKCGVIADLLAASFRSIGRGDACVVTQFYRLSAHVVVGVTHGDNVPVPVVPELHMGTNGCRFCTTLDGALGGPVSCPAVTEPVIFPRAAVAVGGSIARAVNVLHPHLPFTSFLFAWAGQLKP